MKSIKILLFILSCILLQACPFPFGEDFSPDIQLRLKNNSDENIYLFADNSDTIITSKSIYIDADNSNIKAISAVVPGYILLVPKDSTLTQDLWTGSFETRNLYYINFKQTKIEKYKLKEIKKNDIFDKRYVFSLEDLKAIDYTVVYDGE